MCERTGSYKMQLTNPLPCIVEHRRKSSIFIENITYRNICATLQLQDSYVVQIDSVTKRERNWSQGKQSHMLPLSLFFHFPLTIQLLNPNLHRFDSLRLSGRSCHLSVRSYALPADALDMSFVVELLIRHTS